MKLKEKAKIDELIESTKKCTKALMKLSFKNYIRNEKLVEYRISDKNKLNNDY